MSKLYGFINEKGEQIIENKYKYVSDFNEGLAKVEEFENFFLFINKNGAVEFSINCEDATSVINGFVIFKKNEKYGVLNNKGEEIIECKYDKIKEHKDGLFAVKSKEKWGFLNSKNEVIVDFAFEELDNLVNDRFCGKYNKKWGLYDIDGSYYIENAYEEMKYIGSFVENYAIRRSNSNWEISDQWGNLKSNSKFISVNRFFSDFALASIKKYHLAFLDLEGDIAINLGKLNIISASDFCNDFGEEVKLTKITKIIDNNKLSGFINLQGKEIIECKFDSVSSFSDGLARVGLNYKFGFINAFGDEQISIKYKNLGHFRSGFAKFESRNNGEKTFGFLNNMN